MRTFPEQFDPDALAGPRGRQFLRREDSFQQLVGDGLRELRGGLGVHVSTTRGRDGSIDVLIEPIPAGDDRCLPELKKPLIVECKDCAETGSDLRKNLFASWAKVAETLSRQAAAGWPGDYAPWRSVRTYVYAVSARLPKAQLRIDLRTKISAFFDGLPHRPPLRQIEVVDWSDLRALWESAPRVGDRWLGVGLETILGHDEQMVRLAGFRGYLLERNMPFLEPDSGDPAHPNTLLARLSGPNHERGLLLEGPGGVGKSRTLIEVAVRADAAGWRVLHAQPGEPALTHEDLEKAVLAGSGPTLVTLDYFDQMQLDPARLRQRILPAAAARSISLALFATARPGTQRSTGADREMFDVVSLRPSVARARAVSERLLANAAPRALKTVGHKRLAQVCGLRPIIALLVAREVERRVEAGTLGDVRLAGVRSGDLTGWLRRRLSEDGLATPLPQNPLEPAAPNAHLVAAAATLAAAPQSEIELRAAAERAFYAIGLDGHLLPSEQAWRVVSVIHKMGWLETRDGQLAAAHDVVADELMHDVLVDRPAALVRKPEFEAVLAPGLSSARTL